MALIKNTSTNKNVRLANFHTGAIHLPTMYNKNVSGDPAQMRPILAPRTIPAGQTVEIPAEEFAIRKESPAFQYYIDHGHIGVVKKEGEVDIQTDTTTDLEVPEHLQTDSDGAVTVASTADPNERVKAKIVSANKGTANIG